MDDIKAMDTAGEPGPLDDREWMTRAAGNLVRLSLDAIRSRAEIAAAKGLTESHRLLIDAMQEWHAESTRLLREVADSGIERDDGGYVVVQIDRATWDQIRSMVRGGEER